MPTVNLFTNFGYAELTKNMRQQGDSTFADLLLRMRVQQLNDDDVEVCDLK